MFTSDQLIPGNWYKLLTRQGSDTGWHIKFQGIVHGLIKASKDLSSSRSYSKTGGNFGGPDDNRFGPPDIPLLNKHLPADQKISVEQLYQIY